MDLSLLWQWTSTYQNLTGWPSQKCELQSFVFQKVPIWQRLLANQLGGFEYNFRCLKRFFRKVPQKLRSAFFLKLSFLKIRLLVTWLKCLIEGLRAFAESRLKVYCAIKWGVSLSKVIGNDLAIENVVLNLKQVAYFFLSLCTISYYINTISIYLVFVSGYYVIFLTFLEIENGMVCFLFL